MDEMGYAEWPDAHPDIVYVPRSYTLDTVLIAVSRMGKRITLTGCICADGSFATTMLIILRHTTGSELTMFGVSDRNCHVRHQSNSFIDRELFEWWFVEIFIPEIE
jgi:hypothetical protein